MLPAYEIGALTESDAEKFEQHVLECDACLSALKELQPYNEILRLDTETRGNLKVISGNALDSGRRSGSIVQYIWPDTPLVFRPAISYFLVLLLLGILLWPTDGRETKESPVTIDNVGQVQIVTFAGIRDGSEQGFSLSDTRRCLVRFLYTKADKGKPYRVAIENESGETILTEDGFRFDKNKTGYYLVPRSVMSPGKFTLKLYDPTTSVSDILLEFDFFITN
ncbi:MAG: zf-HC2 domain-containing protein [Candidatus Zixiibacteriota bacterium]